MGVDDCKTLQELMTYWRNKEPQPATYEINGETREIVINHRENFFIPDGIIDENVWNTLPQGKKILFVLKEAYEDNHENEGWSLNVELRESGPWSAIWNRVSEWSYGISNTFINTVAPYRKLDKQCANEYLRKISVLNIKKSGGQRSSVYEEISAYAKEDSQEIIREIELIDPDIIICGATFADINEITGRTVEKDSNDNWYYFIDAVGGKERLFIDYYHPANRYPALLNYYGIVGIYQQALRSKN